MNHCHRFLPAPTTRREMLMQAAHGFGGVALATMLAGGKAPAAPATGAPGPLDSKATHYRAKARRVIFLFLNDWVFLGHVQSNAVTSRFSLRCWPGPRRRPGKWI